jgi:hypothetical protein
VFIWDVFEININEAQNLNFEVFIMVTVQIVVFGVVRPCIVRLLITSLSDLTLHSLTLRMWETVF